jgi:hypothetical protein
MAAAPNFWNKESQQWGREQIWYEIGQYKERNIVIVSAAEGIFISIRLEHVYNIIY